MQLYSWSSAVLTLSKETEPVNKCEFLCLRRSQRQTSATCSTDTACTAGKSIKIGRCEAVLLRPVCYRHFLKLDQPSASTQNPIYNPPMANLGKFSKYCTHQIFCHMVCPISLNVFEKFFKIWLIWRNAMFLHVMWLVLFTLPASPPFSPLLSPPFSPHPSLPLLLLLFPLSHLPLPPPLPSLPLSSLFRHHNFYLMDDLVKVCGLSEARVRSALEDAGLRVHLMNAPDFRAQIKTSDIYVIPRTLRNSHKQVELAPDCSVIRHLLGIKRVDIEQWWHSCCTALLPCLLSRRSDLI